MGLAPISSTWRSPHPPAGAPHAKPPVLARFPSATVVALTLRKLGLGRGAPRARHSRGPKHHRSDSRTGDRVHPLPPVPRRTRRIDQRHLSAPGRTERRVRGPPAGRLQVRQTQERHDETAGRVPHARRDGGTGCLFRGQEDRRPRGEGRRPGRRGQVHLPARQHLQRRARLHELPRPSRPRHDPVAAPGRSAPPLHRGPAPAVQHPRTHQRQRGDAHRGLQAHCAGNAGGGRLPLVAGLVAPAVRTG